MNAEMVMHDTAMVKMHLTFTAEQAVIVKGVLGPTPAERLLEICTGMISK